MKEGFIFLLKNDDKKHKQHVEYVGKGKKILVYFCGAIPWRNGRHIKHITYIEKRKIKEKEKKMPKKKKTRVMKTTKQPQRGGIHPNSRSIASRRHNAIG